MVINIRRFNCLRLWRIWTFFLILFLHFYLICDSVSRYISFKKCSMDPAFGSNYSLTIMNVYLITLIGGITLIIISFYCIFCRNGNYADDGIKLGRDIDNLILHEENGLFETQTNKSKRTPFYCLNRLKRNFLPLSCVLHYLSAICFLMPLPFVEAHQIHQGISTPNNLWHTDLDFLFDPDNWHTAFVLDNGPINWILRPQYFNLILSLVSISLKYASVFWCCHKGFSFIFSLLMMLSSLHVLLDYSATTVLIRLAYNPDFVSESLRITFFSPSGLLTLSFLGSSVILLMFWSVFEFGFRQYIESVSRYQHIVTMQSDISHSELSIYKKNYLYLRGYLPHLSVLCGCAIGIGLKIPLLYSGINIVYKLTGDPLHLTNLLIGIICICSWFIIWFGFSLKPTWRFKPSNYSKVISDISSTTTIVVQQPKKQSPKQINEVYSCFHNLDNRITVANSALQNRLRNRDYFVDEADMNTKVGCTNYVYLQSAINPGINQMMQSNPVHCESPLVTEYLDHSDLRNMAHGSESSYDSASNIRNQYRATVDFQIGRSQSQELRNFGNKVLKYSRDNVRIHTKEYIPLQTDTSYGRTIKFENSSSPDTSTLHAAESDTTLKSNPENQQQFNQSLSINRENSNKRRICGPRVTFKDEQSQDILDCSPNNSEQSSSNTASSDSGVDFNSKQRNNIQNHQLRNDYLESMGNSQTMTVRSIGSVTNTKYIPTAIYSGTPRNPTQYTFDTLTQIESNISGNTEKSLAEDALPNENDTNSVSCISDDLPDQRLCSEV